MKKPRDSSNLSDGLQMCRNEMEGKPTMQYFSLLGRSGKKQYGGDIHSEDWTIIIQCNAKIRTRKILIKGYLIRS